MTKRHIYGEIEEPTADELAEVERLLNPDKLLRENLSDGFSNDSVLDERWLDFSRTEGGYRRESKISDRSNAVSQAYDVRLNNVSIDELALDKRTITELNKIGVFNIADLISTSREKLKTIKFVGSKGISEISAALLKMDLHLEDDEIYECVQCSKKFATKYDSQNTTYCPLCQLKRTRLSKISLLQVSLLPPDYATYTDMGEGFSLTANIENASCDQLQKVTLGDFYIVSNGQQHSPKYFLSGYVFKEEDIWPMTTRSCAKIWSIDSLGKERLTKDDYAIITLKSMDNTHMFKFVYNGAKFILDDYFRN